jgi:hypothetical protein
MCIRVSTCWMGDCACEDTRSIAMSLILARAPGLLDGCV